MLKVIIPIAIALAIIIGCVIYLNIDFTLNKGEEDVTYNGIVYERVDLHYNIEHSEENAKKIGSYGQIYAYGQEYIYDLYQLNENILYTPHATFLIELWGTKWIVFPNAVYGSAANYAAQYGYPALFDKFDYTDPNSSVWDMYD